MTSNVQPVAAAACPGAGITSGDIIDNTETPPENPSPIINVPKEALTFVDPGKDLKIPTRAPSFQRLGTITGTDGKTYHLFTSSYEYLLNPSSTYYGFLAPGSDFYTISIPRELMLRLAQANGDESQVNLGTYNPVYLALLKRGVLFLGGTPVMAWGAIATSVAAQRVQNIPISLYETSVIMKSVYGFVVIIPDAAVKSDQAQLTAQVKLMQVYRDFEPVESKGFWDAASERLLALVDASQAGNQVGTKFGPPDTTQGAAQVCDITVSTELTAQMKQAYASWSVNNATNSVNGTNEDADQYGVCGKPKLNASIFTYAFCNLLLSFVDLLKYFLP